MKKFQIQKVNLENIKTYVLEEIDFSLGNNVLLGENGAGKSTILESIFLSIFGETVPGRRLVDMIRYGERQGRIITKFSVNGEDFQLTDEITRKDLDRAVQKPVLLNTTINETIAEGSKAVKAKIEEILDIDATTFISAVYASQGEIGKIVTSKESERKKLFDRLFQIDRYEKAWQNLSKVDKIIATQMKILEVRSVDLKEDVKSLPTIEKQIEEKKDQLKDEKSQLIDLNKTYKDLDQQYKEIWSAVEDYRTQEGKKETTEEEIKALNLEIDLITDKLSEKTKSESIDISVPSTKKLLQLYKRKNEDTKKSLEEARNKEKELSINLEKIKNLETSLTTLIRTTNSKQKQQNDEIKQISEEIDELGLNIAEWEEKLPVIIAEYKNELQIYKKEMKKIDNLQKKISLKETELKSLEETASRYQSRIVKNRLFLSKEAGDNWKDIILEYSDIAFEKQLKKLEANITKLDERHSELKNERSILEMNINRIKEDLQHLTKLQGEETCPTCKQILSTESLKKLCAELTKEKALSCDKKKEVIKELTETTNSLEAAKKNEKELANKFRLFEKTYPTFSALLESEKEKDDVEADCEKQNLKLKELKEDFSQEKTTELEEKIAALEDQIYNLNAIKKSVPRLIKTAKQIKDDFKVVKDTKVQITQLKKKGDLEKLQEKTEEISELDSLEDKYLDIISDIEDLIDKIESKQENNKKLENISVKLVEIESIAGFNDRNEIEANWKKLSDSIASINTSIIKLKEEIIPPLVEQKKTILEKKNQLEKLDEAFKQENKKKKIVSILRSLMRELPNRLLPNYIDRISNTATEILQSIIPESDIQSINVNSDYSLNIVRLGNIEDITVLSGGETIIIALALRLAFAKEFSSLDTLILDEPTIFLDERRRGELVSVLEKNRLVGQMVVVTHDPDFERISDKTHIINKERGETSIEPINVNDPKENENDLLEFELS